MTDAWQAEGARLPAESGIAEPLKTPLFRRIWSASLLSNLGLLVQPVGVTWLMTQLTSAVSMVAFVQTALVLPIMLVSVLAGAVVDMYDKRNSEFRSVGFPEWRDAAQPDDRTAVAHAVEPACLLLSDRNRLCIVQLGIAVLGQRWVPPHTLPQAIALNSISYTIA